MTSGRLSYKLIPFLEKLQLRIAQLYEPGPCPQEIKTVCGVDAAYRMDKGAAAAVVWDRSSKKVIESRLSIGPVIFPYLPGFLFIREAPLLLDALEQLKTKPDLLLVDGHGLAHPRKAGLAVILGVLIDLPTIGIAKSLLIGEVHRNGKIFQKIVLEGSCVGYYIKRPGVRVIYASPGNRVSIDDVKRIVQLLGPCYPHPLREADRLVREWSKNSK